MAQSKPLFVPWLREKIDSGRYPGLSWTNQERTNFCIPWKHALRQDSSSDDVLIFKAWAETSNGGQSEGKTPGDPSVWKRNFRSALRAKGFKLYHDNKNDAANPHKVYQWPKDGPSGGHQEQGDEGSQDSGPQTPCPVFPNLYLAADDNYPVGNSPDLLGRCLEGLDIAESQPVVLAGPVYSDEQQHYGGLNLTEGATAGQEVVAGVTGLVLDSSQEPLLMMSPNEGEIGLGPFCPSEVASNRYQFSTEEPAARDQTPVPGTQAEKGTGFRVIAYYKGVKLSEQSIENVQGFRLVNRQDVDFPTDLPVVRLPSTDSILDQTQAKLTRRVLDNLGGLEVRVEGPPEDMVVVGYRWGDSRVYWSLCKHDQSGQPNVLPKKEVLRLYSFKDYISGLMYFMEDKGRRSPSNSLFFCLGEKWPDPNLKPWEKKLIIVEVVLTTLERLKEMALAGGASSLQSDDLQLSLEQMMEIC